MNILNGMDGRNGKPIVGAPAFLNDECRSKLKVLKQKHNEPSCKSKSQKCQNEESTEKSEIAPISIDILNADTLTAIFSYLPIMDLIKLEKVSERWKQIIELSYRRFKKINMGTIISKKNFQVEKLECILKRIGEHLTHLELPLLDYDKPFKKTFTTMNRYCKNLKHLEVNIFAHTPNDLNGISKHIAQNLKSLHVFNHGNICDGALSLILKKATNLEEFQVTALCLKGSSLSKLPKTCKTLSVRNSYSVNNAHLAKALENLPNLKNLDVSYCGFIKPSALFAVCDQLVSLNIEQVRNFFFLDFMPYKGIEFRDLSFPNLRKLNASEIFLDDEVLEGIIEKCPLLENLSLRGANSIHAVAFCMLENLKHLIHLNVSRTKIGNDALIHLASMSDKFQTIECSDCENITQEGLIQLIDYSPKLKYLKIGPSDKLNSNFFKYALKSVKERSNGISLKIEISFQQFFDVAEAKWVWGNEAERLNLVKRKGQSSACNCLRIRPTYFRYKKKQNLLNFWYVNSDTVNEDK